MPRATVRPTTAKPKAAKKTVKPAGPDRAFAPIDQAFASAPGVTAGVMMASYGLKVNGKIFAMSVRGDLVVKLPRARVDALVAAGTGVHFDPGHGRLMKEWIVVSPGATPWLPLAREAHQFVGGVPARPSAPTRPARGKLVR
jgi:hypothetical protein